MTTGDGLLDEGIDDVILDGVHDDGEQEHDEDDLDRRVPLRPSQGPVPDFDDPRQQLDDEEDAYLHPQQSHEVDHRLFEPPRHARRVAVVSGLYRLGRIRERSVHGKAVEKAEDEEENGDTESGLDMGQLIKELGNFLEASSADILTSIPRFSR